MFKNMGGYALVQMQKSNEIEGAIFFVFRKDVYTGSDYRTMTIGKYTGFRYKLTEYTL